MKNMFHNTGRLAGWGWLLVVLLLNGCRWNLETRTFPRCETPTAEIKHEANLLSVKLWMVKQTGTINAVNWNYGGSGTVISTAQDTARFTYTQPGSYTVTARLTNPCGDRYTYEATHAFTVSNIVKPTVSIQDPTDITSNGATLRMQITSNGGGVISRYGLCYSSSNSIPTIESAEGVVGNTANAAENVVNAFPVNGLQPNKTYYVVAFAQNAAATDPQYSDVVKKFTTKPLLPSVTTTGISAVDKGSIQVRFRLDEPGRPPATRYGVCYSASTTDPRLPGAMSVEVINPEKGVPVYVTLGNLNTSTRYYYRAFAVYADGVAYGDVQAVTTGTEDLSSGLMANLPFDGDGRDISGAGNNAILRGQPTFTANRKGTPNTALNFDGKDDYIELANLRFTSAFTISCWIRPTAKVQQERVQLFIRNQFATGAGEQFSAIIKPAATGSASGRPQINVEVKQGSKCVIAQGWQTMEQPDIVQVNDWHQVVFVYEGTAMKLYYDGGLVQTKRNLPQAFLDDCEGGELKFGVLSNLIPNFFEGAMDDIRIYNRALTDYQVSALYGQ